MRYYPPVGENELKEAEVATMFNAIAQRYDKLNRVLSFGLDRVWRTAAIRRLGNQFGKRVLDVATGTGDVAFAMLELKPEEIMGVDISDEMLQIARQKSSRYDGESIYFVKASAEQLPFESNSFNGAIVAFGVRNFANLDAGLRSIKRVLKPQAPLVVLEFSQPKSRLIQMLYRIYSRWILPRIGRVLSGVTGPYTYLPDSIEVFPSGQSFLARLQQCGFERTRAEPLTFGIVSLYIGYATEDHHDETGGIERT